MVCGMGVVLGYVFFLDRVHYLLNHEPNITRYQDCD